MAPSAGLRLNVKTDHERINAVLDQQQKFDPEHFNNFNMVNGDFHRKANVGKWLKPEGFLGATTCNFMNTNTSSFSPGEEIFRFKSLNPDFVRGAGETFPVKKQSDADKMYTTHNV